VLGQELRGRCLLTTFRLRDLLVQPGLDLAEDNGRQEPPCLVPIEPKMGSNPAHEYTREIAERLAGTAPGRYTTSAALSARPGKLFIDYLRNGRGATAIGAYSPRARPGFPVAAPLTWHDVEHGVRPDAFSMAHPPPRAKHKRSG
jgi:bifunctional non-homologous end joining protein LigD